MAVLIFHSYLLRGTGSNVYNAELSRELARQGRDVHIFCQDREAANLSWVDAVGTWGEGGLEVLPAEAPSEAGAGRGTVTAYVPEIDSLLPVFVSDRYRGYEVKTFPELTERELARYLEANVAAVRDVAARQGPFEAVLANHLIMAPAILARAGLRFAIKVHGSDLSYAVQPHPERFVPYAREGLEAAAGVLVGSAHTARQLLETVPLEGLSRKVRLGPPGLDADRFRPLGREQARRALLSEAEETEAGGDGEGEFGREPARAAAGLRWFAAAEGAGAVFIGKLLINKGVDLLLAAWPLIHAGNPGVRLLLGGFGGFREGTENLLRALEEGDLDAARLLAERAAESGEQPRRLRLLSEFLRRPPDGYADACRAASGSVRITGRLEHREVAAAVVAADLFFMPSTFPEAFGMVAAEAAASGTFPIAARHSGVAEVVDELSAAVAPSHARRLGFDLDRKPIETVAENGLAWLDTPVSERLEVEAALSATARERWGWGRVAGDVIAAANGDLTRLSTPEYTFRALQ